MNLVARCAACGHAFEVAPELAGGITNCPSCGVATEVEGLRDPLWRLLQLGVLVAVVVLGVVVGRGGGAAAGITAAGIALVAAWLVSRAL